MARIDVGSMSPKLMFHLKEWIDSSGVGIITPKTVINETIIEAPLLGCFIDKFNISVYFKPCYVKPVEPK